MGVFFGSATVVGLALIGWVGVVAVRSPTGGLGLAVPFLGGLTLTGIGLVGLLGWALLA